MATHPARPRPETVALAQRAAALEARGAWADAIGVWSNAVERDPSFLPAQLGLAQAQIRAGRPTDALPMLERVGTAIAVNADARLRCHARRRGWAAPRWS